MSDEWEVLQVEGGKFILRHTEADGHEVRVGVFESPAKAKEAIERMEREAQELAGDANGA